MKLFYDPTAYNNIASPSLKVHEQTFCKWAHRNFQSAYGVGFKYIKDELQKANIISWEAWQKCPEGTLNELLAHTRQVIGLMYDIFNHQTSIYFTEQDLAVLACKMCLAALHEMRASNPEFYEENK